MEDRQVADNLVAVEDNFAVEGSPAAVEGSPAAAEAGSLAVAEGSLAVAEERPAVDSLVVTVVQMSSYNLNKRLTQAEDFRNWGNLP